MIKETLQIMEIERFAIHDGPGIRTVVFIQGCPLHCPWCANPESQVIKTHLLFNESKCSGCQSCIKTCPQNALAFVNNKVEYDESNCIDCNSCVENCLYDAIKFIGKQVTITEIITEIEKDKDYYEDGGGVTISGGEAYVQFSSLMILLKELKSKGYHICIETCGQVSFEKIKQSLPFIDLFLFDLKHINNDKFNKVTGGNLEEIKNNIIMLAKENSDKIIIRIPVIPGFNHNQETIEGIVKFCAENNIKTVQLLPFHNLGKNKYKQMNLKYQYEDTKSLKKEDIIGYQVLGNKYNLNIII